MAHAFLSNRVVTPQGTRPAALLIEDGKISYSAEYEVGASFTRAGHLTSGGGYVLRAPTIDIAEIGAGGGSIVWVDAGGALQVGPKRAGASPGHVSARIGRNDGRDFTRAYQFFDASSSLHGTSPR